MYTCSSSQPKSTFHLLYSHNVRFQLYLQQFSTSKIAPQEYFIGYDIAITQDTRQTDQCPLSNIVYKFLLYFAIL